MLSCCSLPLAPWFTCCSLLLCVHLLLGVMCSPRVTLLFPWCYVFPICYMLPFRPLSSVFFLLLYMGRCYLLHFQGENLSWVCIGWLGKHLCIPYVCCVAICHISFEAHHLLHVCGAISYALSHPKSYCNIIICINKDASVHTRSCTQPRT